MGYGAPAQACLVGGRAPADTTGPHARLSPVPAMPSAPRARRGARRRLRPPRRRPRPGLARRAPRNPAPPPRGRRAASQAHFRRRCWRRCWASWPRRGRRNARARTPCWPRCCRSRAAGCAPRSCTRCCPPSGTRRARARPPLRAWAPACCAAAVRSLFLIVISLWAGAIASKCALEGAAQTDRRLRCPGGAPRQHGRVIPVGGRAAGRRAGRCTPGRRGRGGRRGCGARAA